MLYLVIPSVNSARYDCVNSVVIRAKNKEKALEIAKENAGMEGEAAYCLNNIKELFMDGEDGVICCNCKFA